MRQDMHPATYPGVASGESPNKCREQGPQTHAGQEQGGLTQVEMLQERYVCMRDFVYVKVTHAHTNKTAHIGFFRTNWYQVACVRASSI